MLVLTRKQNETIQIGDSITITVLRMKGKAVRLGIKAPHDLSVIRGELTFGQSADERVAQEADAVEAAAEEVAKRKASVRGPRRDNAWATDSVPSAPVTAGGCGAWTL